MKQAKCILDKDYIICDIDPRLYGSFIEHMGRAIYSGIYEPGHPMADEQGFRKDVMELVKGLKVPIVRYPGGNFVSGYNWVDGIGPRENRPRRLELAWSSIETNEIGIDEFADWAKKVNAEVMPAVNLGTGTPKEAGYMLEYCNHPSGTYWSDLRIKNGHKQPHKFKVWCLGNEMDGSWQICSLSADEYGRKARETAKIMKWIDSDVELVACGSSNTELPSYPEWDRKVLEYVYDYIDYYSLHRYYEQDEDNNVADFLASFFEMESFIKTIIATADYVKAKNRSKKTMYLSFDEWNVWYCKQVKLEKWQIAPAISEENYSLLDALVVGGMLCTLLKNSDRIRIACQAQLVNTIAPILTQKGGTAIKQTIYYPFQQVSTYGRGELIKPILKCPLFETKKYGDVPVLQSAAAYDAEKENVNLFVLNCDQNEDINLSVNLRSFGDAEIIEHVVLDGADINAINSFEEPYKVMPREAQVDRKRGNEFNLNLSKLSWNMIRFSIVS